MKLSGRDASRYFAKPKPDSTGLLIFGADAMRVAMKRQEVITSLIGPRGDEEMRLARIPASDLRKDPAMLGDAIKAQGFFPGPRVAFVEEATDGLANTIKAALADWAPGDAQVIVTAGQLNAKSPLRQLFEKHPNAYAAGIYDNPPTRDEIESELTRAGLRNFDGHAMTDLTALAQELDPGDFRQTLEKLALYKLGDDTQVTSDDIAACAPASTEADIDDILNIVAEGRAQEIGPVMARLDAQGMQPVALCIGATRHFRTLFAAASDPGGAAQGIARMRPPIFGPRRDRMLRQAQGWGAAKLEMALTILTDTDLALRSAGQTAPQMALVERALIRLAMLSRRGG
ncbi:DNA polymerase III subunit delta [Lutimaribacter sp. EGI FJ00015]|uniref:DNA polymerase III subunit delta n=1 Tax=Lutimaribacter degradans TaxID=2945989 RepID=A0ACC5ZYB3_9RHOB|nr:DNA polymerase III subunit delta [Lutimaribacter sp. EGI FJ00013]MCM2562539.1 DNA polymerase III subunit delta [Lutimaribacter sp. EGI FJ00013]MCO0613696.1 DNA polymerase III subunit delta [Lutimaribacter sp. EGI FJ00015]MCO0636821.1 DNA polymerase III subunit delta [Lutimaribacter sp. EGI FJ00014]